MHKLDRNEIMFIFQGTFCELERHDPDGTHILRGGGYEGIIWQPFSSAVSVVGHLTL